MIFSLYDRFGAGNSPPVFQAFAQGARHLGHTILSHDDDADVAVIWSKVWHGRMRANQDVWRRFRASGRAVIVLEVGMLQRNLTWRVMVNNDAHICNHHDTERAQHLKIDLKPWTHQGDRILLCLQRPDSEQWLEMPDTHNWVRDIVRCVRQHTDRPLEIRPHPRSPGCFRDIQADIVMPRRVPDTYDNFDFENSVSSAWAVINWNSSPGVVAVINGVPAFVGPDSLAAPVANLDLSHIEQPARPDRDSWLQKLAWTEWHLDEISDGTMMIHLVTKLQSM